MALAHAVFKATVHVRAITPLEYIPVRKKSAGAWFFYATLTLMLTFLQSHRLAIYLVVLTGSFLKLCTGYPQTEPAWALFAVVLLGYLDWWYVGQNEVNEVKANKKTRN